MLLDTSKEIVVVSKYFLPAIGGGERQLLYACQAFSRMGAVVRLFTAQYGAAKFARPGCYVEEFSATNGRNDFSQCFEQMAFRLGQQEGPFAHGYMIFYQKNGVREQERIIHILYSKVVGRLIGRFSSLGEATSFMKGCKDWRKIIDMVDGVISLNPLIWDELRTLGWPEEKIIEFVNPVDTEIFNPSLREQIDCTRDGKVDNGSTCVFLVVGRPHPKKRWKEIVSAAHLTFNKRDLGPCRRKLWFVYQHNNSAYMEAYLDEVKGEVRRRELDRDVEFLDQYKFNSINDIYARADYCIGFSVNEGMQNALIEAAACGVDLIVTTSKQYDFVAAMDDRALRVNESVTSLADGMATGIRRKRDGMNVVRRGERIQHIRDTHHIRNYEMIFERST